MKRRSLVSGILMGFLAVSMASASEWEDKYQDEPKGGRVNSYREGKGDKGSGRPAWVADALSRSLAHLKEKGKALDLEDAEAELELRGADQDDLNQTHVRLDQVQRGVPVFGGQLFTQVDRVLRLSRFDPCRRH